jgi:AmiR/NasT family two-component response regulator
MSATTDGEAWPADMQQRVDDLEARHAIDQAELAFVEAEEAAELDKIAHLEAALVSSRRIGAAIGIVMARRHVAYDEAVDLFRIAGQNGHRKLREIAEDVIFTGDVP